MKTDVVAIDNVFIDLGSKVKKSGDLVKNYGRSWVNIYIPCKVVKSFSDKFSTNTGWSVSGKGLIPDDMQGLVSVVANMDEGDPPQFYVYEQGS